MSRIRTRPIIALIALNKLLNIVILYSLTRDCSFSLHPSVKPPDHKDKSRFIVCLHKFHLYYYYTSRLVPALSTQGHKGIPFCIRYTSWTPHPHSQSRKLNSTLPTRPTLFFEVCAFRTYIDISYITYISLVPIIYPSTTR
jgi:hypothetical protein